MAEKLAPARTSALARVAIGAIGIFSGLAAACSLFVPLDGIEDGVTNAEAGIDASVDAPLEIGPFGDAGIDVATSDAADGGDGGDGGGCPGTAGPPMIDVGGYCIDETEVTRAQYGLFLQSGPTTSGQPAVCSWNVTYLPTPFDLSQPDLPVVYVDWCDAYAYCKWAGKRLCGKIGGGPLPFGSASTDPSQSQWYRACSKNGTSVYPYGSVYDATACNGARDGGALAKPKAFTKCVGGYAGVYDMAGNVEEWQDSCDGTTGAKDNCRDQSGSFYWIPPASSSTQCASVDTDTRDYKTDDVGIRCCSP